MASGEQWPLEVEEYITDTAKIAHVGKLAVDIAARVSLGAEVLNTAYDTFMLHDVDDNIVRAAGIAAVGVAGYKAMDAVGGAVESRARRRSLDNRGDL